MSLWEWSAWSRGWDKANAAPDGPGAPMTDEERAEASAMLDAHT